ncbi:acyltransferase family protein [bacterium]|nr:acyltransferase family protein [bacterium]
MQGHRTESGDHSEDTVAETPERSFRYQTLDAWRGLACVLIVVFHSTMHVNSVPERGASWWDKLGFALVTATKHLNVGVPIFFVISGYCIMATLDSRRRNGEGAGVYFRRRFRRIYPPYWIALAVSSIVIWLVERFFWPGLLTRGAFEINSPTRLNLFEWLGNLTLTESWRFHLTGGEVRYLAGHAWTLCFEEQFYAIAGFILLVAPRRMFLAATLVTVTIPLLSYGAYLSGLNLEGTVVGGEWLFFAAGIVVYHRAHYAGRVGRVISFALLALAIFLPVFDSRHLLLASDNLRSNWVFATLSAFLLATLFRHDRQMSRWRILRPFSYCGRICYSLYLIHPLVTTAIGHAFHQWGLRGNWQTILVTVPVSLAVSLVVSAAFFELIERHFLNSRISPPNNVWSDSERPQTSTL